LYARPLAIALSGGLNSRIDQIYIASTASFAARSRPLIIRRAAAE
jgi:hypothetical protein